MSLEETLKELCSNLASNKATERKRSAETLKNYLTKNAVPDLLSDNTRKSQGFSWNDLFDHITEYLLKETEKSPLSKTFHSITYPLFTSILHLCVAGSIKGKAFIKCDKIMEACNLVLSNKRLTEAVGDAYLTLLYKYVLSSEDYPKHITPSIWEELLDISTTACMSSTSELDDFVRLKLLWLVIKNAGGCSQFSLSLRNSLKKISEYFHKLVNNKKALEVVTDITILTLEMLFLESRLSLCKFAENNLPLIFQFYEQNLDPKKKSQLFKLLNISIMIHHPVGRIQNEESALAHNWDNWNKCLYSIMEIIYLETNHIQKTYKWNSSILHWCPYFAQVAASSYFLIFKMLAQDNENNSEKSAKKPKLTINKFKVFEDLIGEFQKNHIPWIHIIYMYVEHHGCFISLHNYKRILVVLAQLVNNNNVQQAPSIFQSLTCLVLKNILSQHDSGSNMERKELIISLWNSCVRNSTCVNIAQPAIHHVLQSILSTSLLQYHNVKPLFILYFEKGMPVSDHSVKTLILLFQNFYAKSCYNFGRMKCLTWFANGPITNVELNNVRGIFVTLLSNENVRHSQEVGISKKADICHTLFETVEKCILFSNFEFDEEEYEKSDRCILKDLEAHDEINSQLRDYLQKTLYEYKLQLQTKNVKLFEHLKISSITLVYLDTTLTNYCHDENITKFLLIFKDFLKILFTVSMKALKSDLQTRDKNELLQSLQLILLEEYHALLNTEVRQCIDNDFFHCLKDILDSDVPADDDESDSDMSLNLLKHNCILFIAAYCKKQQNFRDELLELILNSNLYNFSIPLDIESALKCIRLLNQHDVENAPLELSFALLQAMCKNLFRDSKASLGILEVLIQMIDKLWTCSVNMRRNCCIMVRSYLHRTESKYYPPKVVALVFKCVAKIIILNLKENSEIELNFMEVLINNLKTNLYSTRLYCSYLINEISRAMSEEDVESCFKSLKDIFTVSVPEDNETILKDELNNRTASLLHAYYRLMLNKPTLMNRIVVEILITQREKSLDKKLVMKMVQVVIKNVTQRNADVYFDKHILFILQCWLERRYSLEDLPLRLFFGADCDDQISMKYMKWLVSADILWGHRGAIQNSEAMQRFKQNIAEATILEKSFSNIIVLSLPYVVNEKYGLRSIKQPKHKELLEAASKMFRQTKEILKNEKWKQLFVENKGELVLLTALHLKDHTDAQKVFELHLPENIETYSYPKEIFYAILKYFSELIGGKNIMEYLCEKQPLDVLKVLFVLWESVISENLFEFKVIFLHTFVTFIENIPLGLPSDAILCNFSSGGIASAIAKTESSKELTVLAKALYIILKRFNSQNVRLQDSILSKILSILFMKKENSECDRVLNFLVRNFIAIKDLYTIITETYIKTYNTEEEVSKNLEMYLNNFSNASITTLSKMGKFLCANKQLVQEAFNKLDGKGFSEEYENSVLHKVVVALCNILRNSTDDKMLIEASNCLSEIGTYDLRTYVTVPPNDTKQLIDVKPTQYFAITAVKSLLEIIFDENPTISYKAAKALYNLMKFKDGLAIDIDPELVSNQILKCLTPATCGSFALFTVDCVSAQWVPEVGEEHLQWIKRITLTLLSTIASTSNYLSSLHSVCNLKPSVCQKVLAPLVGLIIEHSSEEQAQMFGQEINQVFSYIWDNSFNDSAMNSEDHTISKTSSILDHDQKMIVHYLLEVVNTIRLQSNHFKIRKLRQPNALRHMKLEYEKLAWAATLADRNIAAIYYAEHWAVAENGDVPPSSPERTACLVGGENLQRILRNCFVSIGEMDAIDGCGTAHLTSEVEKRQHLLNTGQYSDALLLHDIALSSGPQAENGLQHGVVMTLHKSGMHHLALQYIKSCPDNEDLNAVKYDCLSHLGDWSEIVDTTELEEKTRKPVWDVDVIIKSFRYACLKECLNARPCEAFGVRLTHLLNKAKLATSKLCRILNMENCQSVYNVVANLHLFRDIEDYCSVRCGCSDPKELLTRWQVQNLPSYKSFRHLEPLLSQRSLILEHAVKNYENLSSDIIDLQLQYVNMGLTNQRIQMSQRLLQAVKNMEQTEKVVFVESQLAWEKGQKDDALALLHGAVSDRTSDVKLAAMCLRQYGLWMAECRRENAREIINKYLEKSLEVLNKTDHAETRYKVYHDIAKFADAEYKQIVSYMNSSVFENKVKCIDNLKGIAASFKVPKESLTIDQKKALMTNDRFMKLEADEVSRTREEKESFLNLAMRYYLLSLRHSEDTNLSIFRVISLWFENPSFEFEVGCNANLEEFLQAVPSWKFITVLPQLAPRITTEKSDFAKYLRQILDRCATDHPYHTLPILFNLKNSDKDNCILNASSGSSSRSGRSRAPTEPRIAAAEELISELARRNEVATIVKQMDRLCDAFISFAYFKPKVNDTRPQPIPSAEALSKLRNLAALPIPTVTLPIRKDRDYSTLPCITEFGSHFERVGGMNDPKKITCRSSDGKCRILLIKGEDDLRQDAVMQQVFNIVNKLLENNPITNKNKLLIRTYKVVPLSRRSGVLEWCEGTMPLGVYLVNAHTRYRPKDITPTAARSKLKACHDNIKSNQEKLRVFMAILANFKPVFHNFFTEHYHDPITWYERRLAYTRSIATSSMVGYILGLGDRHVQNILIDKKTAEVVHIDFGIAFDQGKALPTPETIPFRLTQDIIAGFGCCGVEGIFRRCCEKTLQLLRDNQETLLTILEVLLCDPLYTWSLKGPLKNSSVYWSREGESAGSGLAERALLSVGGKLSGTEGGAPGAVSVAGQVARLLHAATDPANLSRLYHGWQPYL